MRLSLPQAACLPVVALCLVNVASAFNFQIHAHHIGLRKQSLQQLHASSAPDGVEDEARKLRELASQLRGEVDAFQKEKDEVTAAEQKTRDEIMAAKQETRMKKRKSEWKRRTDDTRHHAHANHAIDNEIIQRKHFL